ncbi:hypothetical protein KP509_27G022000 [Ceratopteris richardii]|nr:hypothetical protein KP509_27G022000 [Ceratopteris richardii]
MQTFICCCGFERLTLHYNTVVKVHQERFCVNASVSFAYVTGSWKNLHMVRTEFLFKILSFCIPCEMFSDAFQSIVKFVNIKAFLSILFNPITVRYTR